MVPAIMGNPERPELAQELAEAFCSNDPAIASHFARVTFYGDNRKELPSNKLPTLILQCSQDVIAPLTVGEYMHRHMPNSKLVVMEATGHCPQLSAPQEFISCMRNFIEQT